MIHGESPGVLAGAIVLGFVHGVEPGHGWPVAAAYAMDRSNAWAAGFAASLIIGIGHLLSSIAVVFAYFYAIAYFDLPSLDEPIVVAGVEIGGPLGVVAGLLLIGLGIREYYVGGHGHDHGADSSHDDEADEGHHHEPGSSHDHEAGSGHDHEADDGHHHRTDDDHGDDTGMDHSHEETDAPWYARLRSKLPAVGGHQHVEEADVEDRGLAGIAWVAFVLGFAHEEEFEIIALCTGSSHCLELMLAYATAVVVGIVGLTMLLVAGYRHFEERVERITPYLPAFSAAVLITMGLGFALGVI